MEGWSLFAADAEQALWVGIVGSLCLAVGGLVTAIVNAYNSRHEKKSALKLAEDAAQLAGERQQLDYLFQKNKEFLKEAQEQLVTVRTEAREVAKKHQDCEVRLARTEENLARTQDALKRAEQRLANLEAREQERDRAGG